MSTHLVIFLMATVFIRLLLPITKRVVRVVLTVTFCIKLPVSLLRLVVMGFFLQLWRKTALSIVCRSRRSWENWRCLHLFKRVRFRRVKKSIANNGIFFLLNNRCRNAIVLISHYRLFTSVSGYIIWLAKRVSGYVIWLAKRVVKHIMRGLG